MDRKSETDDEYWTESAHKGFDFDESDHWNKQRSQPKLSATVRQNKNLNQLDLLRCDGLSEVAENSQTNIPASDDAVSFGVLFRKENVSARSMEKYDPLTLQVKKKHKTGKLTASQTVINIILGLEYSLEQFKGKEEKLELLAAAVKSHDGNAIITAVLFLRKTLKKSIFQREIVQCPAAINMYLSYLEEDHEIDELTNMLLLLGRTEEAAMLKYNAAISVEHVESKSKWLENCLSTHFQVDSVGDFLASAVSRYHHALKVQMAFEKFHLEQAPSENVENQKSILAEKITIVDTSIINIVFLSCLYYYHLPENHEFSPYHLKKVFNLTNKQYTWTAIRALASCQKWQEIEDMCLSKSWLGGKTMKCCIGFPQVLEILSKC